MCHSEHRWSFLNFGHSCQLIPLFRPSRDMKLFAWNYQIKIIFVPKFHCELNAIERLWCDMKQYVKKMSDQIFSKMLRLIPESRENFKKRQIQMKLFRRFWRSLDMYSQGKSYGEVLNLVFSQSCKSEVVYHRRVTNDELSWWTYLALHLSRKIDLAVYTYERNVESSCQKERSGWTKAEKTTKKTSPECIRLYVPERINMWGKIF